MGFTPVCLLTRHRIYAKLTDREGGTPFLHTHHNWDYEVLD